MRGGVNWILRNTQKRAFQYFVDAPFCLGEEEGVCYEGGGGEDQEETQLGSAGATIPTS